MFYLKLKEQKCQSAPQAVALFWRCAQNLKVNRSVHLGQIAHVFTSVFVTFNFGQFGPFNQVLSMQNSWLYRPVHHILSSLFVELYPCIITFTVLTVTCQGYKMCWLKARSQGTEERGLVGSIMLFSAKQLNNMSKLSACVNLGVSLGTHLLWFSKHCYLPYVRSDAMIDPKPSIINHLNWSGKTTEPSNTSAVISVYMCT